MKTLNLNPQLLRLNFEPSLLKFPVQSKWEIPTLLVCFSAIVITIAILSKLGLVYNSVCGY